MSTRRYLGIIALLLMGLTLSLAGCASTLPEDQVAYNACTAAYNSNRQTLGAPWSFVSGTQGQNASCYWHWGATSTADATNLATAECSKHYANCYMYATSDGWSPWVKRISDNGGHSQGSPSNNDNSLSDQCKMGLFKAGLQTGIDVIASLAGKPAPYNGSNVDPNDCAH